VKLRWFALGLLLLSSSGSARGLLACGDKYFVTVLGIRYSLVSMSDTEVLIYKNPASEIPKLFASIAVEDQMGREGFLLTVVTSESDFKRELARGRWAIVIAGAADAQNVRSLNLIDRSVLIPVVDNTTSAELKQIKDQYPVVLKATPANSEAFLSVIYRALGHRPKSQVKSAKLGSR
jgi:hypothetical protein